MKNKQITLTCIDEFFECYHLNEVRQTMWRRLVTVVSSPEYASVDHHERSNQMHFYEQIEMLVEGVWVVRRGNNNAPVQIMPVAEERTTTHNTRFSKSMRLVEKGNHSVLDVTRRIRKSNNFVV